jgi:acetyltransferase
MTLRTSDTAQTLAVVAILLTACTDAPAPSLEEVRAATSRYQSVDAALADGYTRDPLDVCETAYYLGELQDLGAIGVHFFRRDLLGVEDMDSMATRLDVEGIHDGRTFISSLRAIARAKPVIVLKVGRYASGSQAARSHTGALVGNDAVFDAVLARCGVVRVHSAQDLFAAARALSSRRKPRRCLAVVTNGVAWGARGACSSENVQLAKLAPETIEKLNAILPRHWSHANPVDVIGDADGERFGGAARIVAEDPNVDAVLTAFCPTGIATAESVADGILPVAKECSKPFLTAWLGEISVIDTRHRVEEAGIPAYRSSEVAVQAFAALASHVKNQRLLLESPSPRSTTVEHDIRGRGDPGAAPRDARCSTRSRR